MGIAVTSKPIPKCQVCQHAKLAEINRLLIDKKQTNEGIGQIFGVHPKAVSRHRNNHLPNAMAEYAAQQAVEVLAAEIPETATLHERAEALMARAQSIMEAAERKRDYTSALRGIREMRGCLELMARLAGEIDTTTVNIFAAPTWVTLQTGIIAALEPFPEARAAVLRALPAS